MTNLIIVVSALIFIVFLIIKRIGYDKVKDLFKTDNTVYPDTPVSFGYNCIWIAVKTDNFNRLAEIIHLKNKEKCNWFNGIEKAYEGLVFITPPLNNWTLAVGLGLPSADTKESIEEIKLLLNNLSLEFNEAQYFITNRVTEYHCWIKSVDGIIKRVYAYHGEANQNIVIEGEPTNAEKEFNLVNTFNNIPAQAEIIYPDEEFIMQVANDWSIDPTKLETTNFKGIGLIGKL